MQKLARVLAMPNEAAFHDRLLATADDPASPGLKTRGTATMASLTILDPRAAPRIAITPYTLSCDASGPGLRVDPVEQLEKFAESAA